MRLEQLEYLIEVARTGSINQASEKLHTSQQNLSRVMQQLENELATTLFTRTYQGIELTKHGQKALIAAQTIVPILHQLMADCRVQDDKSDICGKVHLLCAPASIFAVVPEILARFNSAYPDILLTVEEMESGRIFETLAKDSTAIGILSIFFNHSAPALTEQYKHLLHYDLIASDRLAVFLSKKSPLAKQKSISITSLLRHPLALYLSGAAEDNHILAVLKDYGEPNVAFTTRNINIYIQTIAQGNYLGFTSNHVFQKHQFYDKTSLDILPVRDNVDFSTNIATSKNFVATPAATKLIAFIRNLMQ